MPDNLLETKQRFLSLLKRVDRASLLLFVSWLDIKIAEFKIFGYIIDDVKDYGSIRSSGNGFLREIRGCTRNLKNHLNDFDKHSSLHGDIYKTKSGNITSRNDNIGKCVRVSQSSSCPPTNSTDMPNSAQITPQKSFSRKHKKDLHEPVDNMQNNLCERETSSPTPVAMEMISPDSQHVSISLSFLEDNSKNKKSAHTPSLSTHLQCEGNSSKDLSSHQEMSSEIKEIESEQQQCLYKSDQFNDILSQSDYQRARSIFVMENSQNTEQLADQSLHKEQEKSDSVLPTTVDTTSYEGILQTDLENSMKESADLSNLFRHESTLPESDSSHGNKNLEYCEYITIKAEPENVFGDIEDICHSRNIGKTANNPSMVETECGPVPVHLIHNVTNPVKVPGIFKTSTAMCSTKKSNFRSDKLKCTICFASFGTKSSLFRHKALHGKKKLSCYLCGRMFHRREHAKNHMIRHGKTQAFPCFMCNFQTDLFQNLENHVWLAHNISNLFRVHEKPELFKNFDWQVSDELDDSLEKSV